MSMVVIYMKYGQAVLSVQAKLSTRLFIIIQIVHYGKWLTQCMLESFRLANHDLHVVYRCVHA